MSDLPQATKDRFSASLRDRLRAVVDELNLDINDPFTKLLAHAIASREAHDELRGELETCIRQRDEAREYAQELLALVRESRERVSHAPNVFAAWIAKLDAALAKNPNGQPGELPENRPVAANNRYPAGSEATPSGPSSALGASTNTPHSQSNFHTEANAKRLLAMRDYHALDDHAEVWNQLYWLVSDNAADPFHPWAELERLVPDHQTTTDERAARKPLEIGGGS